MFWRKKAADIGDDDPPEAHQAVPIEVARSCPTDGCGAGVLKVERRYRTVAVVTCGSHTWQCLKSSVPEDVFPD